MKGIQLTLFLGTIYYFGYELIQEILFGWG